MEIKTKIIRSIFNTDIERINGKRASDSKSQRKGRDLKKINTQLKKANEYFLPVRKVYRRGFYEGLRNKDFNQFVTLTCKDTVHLGWLIYRTKCFIKSLNNESLIGNYFVVYEHNGDNYHVHILLYTALREGLKQAVLEWKYGTQKTVDVDDQDSKEARISYCTKQLIPDSGSHKIQSLIDAWDLYLTPEIEHCENELNIIVEPFLAPVAEAGNDIGIETAKKHKVASLSLFGGFFYMLWMMVKEQYQSVCTALLTDVRIYNKRYGTINNTG
ncbi:hypothetical protein HDF24_05825 [Mucilaginibacter sp. X4EP1]|uniref:hypothetical protein n=1 Tax=Mucilaginibacter sp. X4EP1 TaxID=2723092 RepID=UPI00216830F1|nr:hypothetical protein [Mucilaginibacter sp. X4EP1]MCS3814385.1 hypothetical protein [Mucilaginibacter sp. X4EP1]